MRNTSWTERVAGVALLLCLALGAWATLQGCHDGCKPEETRCHDNQVEECDHDEDWDLVLDCERLEPYEGEVCCWDPALDSHNCLPPGQCEPDGGTP